MEQFLYQSAYKKDVLLLEKRWNFKGFYDLIEALSCTIVHTSKRQIV